MNHMDTSNLTAKVWTDTLALFGLPDDKTTEGRKAAVKRLSEFERWRFLSILNRHMADACSNSRLASALRGIADEFDLLMTQGPYDCE